MKVSNLLPLTGLVCAQKVCAQSTSGIASNVGGGIPAGLSSPNTSGFINATVQPSRGGRAICVSGLVAVAATGRNVKFNFPIPENQTQVSETVVSLISEGSTLAQQIAGPLQNVSGMYYIGASLCAPANGTSKSTIQILTHGVGFDRYYWDFAPGYSYPDVAAAQGYATFFYDRLGVGQSTKADPIQDLQSPLQVGILAALTQQLKTGKLGGKAFQTAVGVGHSYGSIITIGLTSFFPKLLDSAVITGFNLNQTGDPAFLTALNLAIASQNSPYRFSNLNNGYMVSGNAISNQLAFFKAPNFDPSIVAAADAQKGTLTFGEFFTQGAVVRPATNFTGPVAFVNGRNDLPFCYGDCLQPSDKTAFTRRALYPAARAVKGINNTLVLPTTGHGINLHYSGTTAFQFIQSFIKAAGY